MRTPDALPSPKRPTDPLPETEPGWLKRHLRKREKRDMRTVNIKLGDDYLPAPLHGSASASSSTATLPEPEPEPDRGPRGGGWDRGPRTGPVGAALGPPQGPWGAQGRHPPPPMSMAMPSAPMPSVAAPAPLPNPYPPPHAQTYSYGQQGQHGYSAPPTPRPPAPARLRPVEVPQALVSRFIALAERNTRRGIETCGVLMGWEVPTLSGEKLCVTHLALPEQKGTRDTCTTSNEEDLVSVQLARGLITLGWIHTHPTQTVFMSSADLHTHAGYQSSLPEALAIVCSPYAPSGPKVGIFRLTHPGLTFIQACRLPSLFHPHLVNGQQAVGLYTDAFAHVSLLPGVGVEVLDLRR